MPGALQGLKILDFTTLLPGPYATMCLADMGANVLKIISGSRPDLVDFLPPFIPETKLSAIAAQLGRGKRCMALNLKDPRAITIIHKLVADHDILIEQFRPGVMAKLKLAYEDLKKINPAIIYCSITGYGQTGPLRNRAGHDINYIARSGVASYSGKEKSGPSLTGIQIADVASGSNNAIIGILAAVINRLHTGVGQHIDISMTDGMIAFNAIVGAGFLVSGRDPFREGEYLNGGSIYDYYETKDGKHISFGGLETHFFTNFCNTINRPDLISGSILPHKIKKIKKEIRNIFLTKTRDEWVDIFSRTDACVEPVLTLAEAFSDTLTVERRMVVKVAMPGGSSVRQIGNPVKFSETPVEYRHAGVSGPAHTREVLIELGYTNKEIDEFKETGLFS
ncbi:MAG: carnitine dehydratase [Smithella sp. SDB]|nr:MAG: carnitine dehydratase [Smithella sp. SDB]